MGNSPRTAARTTRTRLVRGNRMRLTLAAVALLLAACSGDDATTEITNSAPAAFPVTVRGTTIPSEPQRIVSLSATHTEVLYEIGAADRIVATDVFSDFPAAANDTEKVDAFNLSVEAVAALEPDLVVLSFDPGDAVSGFEALGIPALLFPPPGPSDLDDVYAEWIDLGTAVGLRGAAESLAETARSEIEDLLESVPERNTPVTFYLELDTTFFTVGEGTLLDTVFAAAGLTNIAGPDAGAFPQLSAEFIVDADPDLIFLADTVCCGQTAETVAARPGWEALSAVQAGRVIELDDSIASRWSDRLVDLLTVVTKEVAALG